MLLSHRNDSKGPRGRLGEMLVKCWWETTSSPVKCASPGCPRRAHHVCHLHPEAGTFCILHRSQHTREVARRNAELDSRPREEAAPTSSRPAKKIDLPRVLN